MAVEKLLIIVHLKIGIYQLHGYVVLIFRQLFFIILEMPRLSIIEGEIILLCFVGVVSERIHLSTDSMHCADRSL